MQILLTRLPQRLQIVIIQRHAPDLLGIPKIVRLAQILLSGIQLAQLGAVARQSCIVIMLSAPTPIFRPRIGFFKVEPAMSQFRVMTALRPSVPDAVTECSPSPKGRPVGPRAQRSNGISSLAFISCLLHIQIPLRVSRCPAPNVSSRCCSSQNISPTLGAMRARRRNLLGTRSRTSPSTTAAQ